MSSSKTKAKFKARVIASDGPAFGAYLGGSAKDGEAVIMLNLKLCLNVDRDPRGCAAETLAHEVLHACQDVMGEALTEKDIIENLDRIQEVEYEVCEDEEQVIQAMTNRLQEIGEQLERFRDDLPTSIKGALKQCIDAHGTISRGEIGSAEKRITGALKESIEQILNS